MIHWMIPPKVEPEPQKVKRALVLPMRRNVDPKKIVIQVPCTETNTTTTDSISDNVSVGEFESDEEDKSFKVSNVTSKDEYTPFSITKVIQNTEYIPSRTLLRKDDFVETIDIHNTTVDKDKGTQFIVTMDGFNPNAFLAKKLMTEGLLNDDEEILTISKDSKKSEGSKKGVLRHISERIKDGEINVSETTVPPVTINVKPLNEDVEKDTDEVNVQVKRPILEKRDSSSSSIEVKQNIESIDRPVLQNQKSDNSDKLIEENRSDMKNLDKETLESVFSVENSIVERHDSATSVDKVTEKRKSDVALESSPSETGEASPPAKRRKASPIIFDVNKKEKEGERVRERTISASSDSHVILTTASNTHKYDTLPPLSQAAKPPAPVWCRAFPSCRYGSSCAFAHPRCKFAAACTRRGCVYSHAHVASPVAAAAPVVASHVVPAANYKTISAGAFANICKYYPNCTNPTCHFYHPKPCRYGKACANKLECNFYHVDVPGGKWKYPV